MPRLEQLRLFEVPDKKNKLVALHRFGGYAKKNSERPKRDYYGTDPRSAKALLDNERLGHLVWEPTSGHGNITRVLEAYGHEVTSTDIEDYGEQDYKQDFLLAQKCPKKCMDIVMNPPYLLATEFVRHALDILEPGRKLCALLRIQFLEGQRRFDEIHVKDPPCGFGCSSKGNLALPRTISPEAARFAIVGSYGGKAMKESLK